MEPIGINIPNRTVVIFVKTFYVRFFLPLTWTQSLKRDTAVIFLRNSDADLHFCLDCAEGVKDQFWNFLKIKSPQQANQGNYHGMHLVYQEVFAWKQTQEVLQRHPICITDSDHDYILETIIRQDRIYFEI